VGEPRLRHGGSKTGFQPLQCEEAPLRACGGSRHSCNNDNQLDDFGYHVRCDPGQRLQSESNVVDGNQFRWRFRASMSRSSPSITTTSLTSSWSTDPWDARTRTLSTRVTSKKPSPLNRALISSMTDSTASTPSAMALSCRPDLGLFDSFRSSLLAWDTMAPCGGLAQIPFGLLRLCFCIQIFLNFTSAIFSNCFRTSVTAAAVPE